MTWTRIDEQLASWSSRLVAEVKVDPDDSRQLATRIAADVRFLPLEAKREIAAASPVAVKARLEELAAFQIWMDISQIQILSDRRAGAGSHAKLYLFRVPSGGVFRRFGQACADPLCDTQVRAIPLR